MQDGFITVFSTVPGMDEGAALARKVVTEKLAACCNIVPSVRSIYMWKGKVCDEGEALCIFKTRASLFDKLAERIKELHGYEVPEVVAIEIKGALSEYLAWIDSVCIEQADM